MYIALSSESIAELRELLRTTGEEIERVKADNKYWFETGRDSLNKATAAADAKAYAEKRLRDETQRLHELLRKWANLPWGEVDLVVDLGYELILDETLEELDAEDEDDGGEGAEGGEGGGG